MFRYKYSCLSFLFLLCLISTASAQSWQWLHGNTQTSGNTEGNVVAADRYGNSFMGGYTNAKIDFSGKIVNPGSITNCNFLVKYNCSGAVAWAIGSSGDGSYDAPTSLATDSLGNIYMSGIFYNHITFGSVTLTSSGSSFYVFKFDSSGNVLWGTCGGNSNFCYLSVDNSGNVFLCGNFRYTLSIGSTSLTYMTTGSQDNIFLAKYSSSGTPLWAKQFGGSGNDHASAVAVDRSGDIYLAGYYTSSVFYAGTYSMPDPDAFDNIFLVKCDGSGNTIWGWHSQNAGLADFPVNIATDSSGNVFMTGSFRKDHIDIGSYTLSNHPSGFGYYNYDFFMAKWNSAAAVQWAVAGGGSQGDRGYHVAIDNLGNPWFTGGFNIPNMNIGVDTIYFLPTYSDPAFLAQLNSVSGSVMRLLALPTGGDDEACIASDQFGNIFWVADARNSAYPFVLAGDTLYSTSDEVACIAKFGYNAGRDTVKRYFDTSLCKGKGLNLTGETGSYSYFWDNGTLAQTRTVSAAGTYWVICLPTDCFSPVAIDSFSIHELPPVSFSLGPDTLVCDSITLTVPVTSASYSWQDGSSAGSYTVSKSGVYSVIVTKNGCSGSDSVKVDIAGIPHQLLEDTTICAESGSAISLQAIAPKGSAVLWSNGSRANSISVAAPGTYWVTVKEGNCIGTDTMTLRTELCVCNAILPNAFTPNKDGRNDFYFPVFEQGCDITNYTFAIYNRWGQQVFLSHDPTAKWDGRFLGIDVEIGTYMYYVAYNAGLQKKKYFTKGDVSVVR